MKAVWIDVSGLKIHYVTAGIAGPAVLLLHGGALDSGQISYKYSIGPLSKHFTVFAPDLPGHGLSDKPDISYTTEFYVKFIGDFMDALSLEKASLVGLSVGGASALGFALRSPLRVSKLVLADTYGIGGSTIIRRLSYPMVHAPLAMELRWAAFKLGPQIVRLGLRNIFYDPRAITDEVVNEVYRLTKQPGEGKAWISYMRSEVLWSSYRTNFMSKLHEVTVPTLIIH